MPVQHSISTASTSVQYRTGPYIKSVDIRPKPKKPSVEPKKSKRTTQQNQFGYKLHILTPHFLLNAQFAAFHPDTVSAYYHIQNETST